MLTATTELEVAMDIFNFIDSRDIREHLRSIDFQPSTIEAAYLLWFS